MLIFIYCIIWYLIFDTHTHAHICSIKLTDNSFWNNILCQNERESGGGDGEGRTIAYYIKLSRNLITNNLRSMH